MEYKEFKSIQEKLSVIGFGCWGISGGGAWTHGSDEDSIKTIHAAIDGGINFFDTAPAYGGGHSETILGHAIKGKRDQVFVASKCGIVENQPDGGWISLKPDSIRTEIDASLKRLDIDCIDLYQMHWPDEKTPIEDSLEALEEIRKSGKIRYIGITNHSADDIKKAASLVDLASCQGLYNLLEHNSESYHTIPLAYRTRSEILPLCRERGIPFLPYSPLLQGLLSSHFEPSEWGPKDVRQSNPNFQGDHLIRFKALADKVNGFAEQLGQPVVQVALNWLVAQAEVGPIICGGHLPEHSTQNAAATNWQLSDSQFSELDSMIASELES